MAMRLTIGELAGETGCKAETIPLLRTDPAARFRPSHPVRMPDLWSPGSSPPAIHPRSRDLGFSLDAIRGLLDLARPNRDCAAADRLSSAHLEEVRDKASTLRRLQRELIRMVAQCRGGKVAECRVIEALSD